MSRSDPRPPAVSGRLLEWAAHRLGTPELIHDAAELFVDKFHRHGERSARHWYRRQALAALCRLLPPGRRAAREGRGLAWLSGLSLDLKLGCRMLVKYPGLTVVGGLGMAVAIAIGASFFDMAAAMLDPTLPLPGGERVVAIQNWDTETSEQERRILHDFATWSEELGSVDDLSAYRTIGRNLIIPGGSTGPIRIAEMTASGFRLAGVPPLLGRTLVEEDERAGAPPVAVIGYDVWRRRFGGDREVVGRKVQIGNEIHTIAGVMPEGFAFPVNHNLWIPFRADSWDQERRAGPGIDVFGRLPPGVTLDEAQAELTTIGLQMAAAFPETHGLLRPRIVPYTLQSLDDSAEWAVRSMQLLISLLLVVICVNVAVLVYARTVSRVGEIAVRTALGASRRRIVAQLFAEALVLSLGAAVVGLAAAELILESLADVMAHRFPFWIEFDLSPRTLVYAAGLAVLAATIVGIVPALKATGRGLRSKLGEMDGATSMRLGRTWTALIVTQVAFVVAFLPVGVFNAWEWSRYGLVEPEFAAEEFLTAELVMPQTDESASAGAAGPSGAPSGRAEASERAFSARYGTRLRELARRLDAEPEVADVAFVSRLPGNEWPAEIEVDGVAMPPPESGSGHDVRLVGVNVGLFDVFDVSILAGRGFRQNDLAPAATAVIVNEAFVEEVLRDANALGRRIRYVRIHPRETALWMPAHGEAMPWYEIVGVVSDDLAVGLDPGETAVRVYHPMPLGQVRPVHIAMRMRGAAAAFAPRLQAITAAVDPALQATEILAFDEVLRQMQRLFRLVALVLSLVTLSVLFLSAAGIHALMSFTVARRRKEIGIRAALGAHPRRLIANIFARALGQLALGVAIGLAAAIMLDGFVEGLTGGQAAVVVPAVAVLMLAVGLLAALGPARRGLRIPPTEALRAE